MSFMTKKKRYKFQVSFEVEELSSVPFISGILFCKVRLVDGGSFAQYSTKEEVVNHVVRWTADYSFLCKLVASASTAVLEACVCRVSVRKEVKGGKSYQKLGYADVNLAEFAGSGRTSRRYILEGYNSKRRQDNSVLKINISMSLLSGDPLFKVPMSSSLMASELVDELQPGNKGGADSGDTCEGSITSACSSGFGSLPRKPGVTEDAPPESKALQDLLERVEGPIDTQTGHARTSSMVSAQSKGSGYSSTHSRTSSLGAGDDKTTRSDANTHNRSLSAGGPAAISGKVRPHTRHKPSLNTFSSIEQRVDDTRISADDLVTELIAQTDLDADDSAETSGLQLYIGSDGQVIVGGQHDRSQIAAGHYERVVIDAGK